MTQSPRAPSAVDVLADSYLDSYANLDPMAATYCGVTRHDGELPDLTPDWFESLSRLRRQTLAALASAVPTDVNDRITIAALQEDLTVAEALRDAGTQEASLNVIESPSQKVREVFALMPTSTIDDWATIATRLAAVPTAIDGYTKSLRLAAGRGNISARRQVEAVIAQCAGDVGPDGLFAAFVRDAKPSAGAELPRSLRADLEFQAERAARSYDDLARTLRDEILPRAPLSDAVGRERYALHSRAFLGTEIDLQETYEWGQRELARITGEMATTAGRIRPGAGIREAMDYLDATATRRLKGVDALQQWMQERADAAVEALADTHFDIPPAIRTLECRIAPSQSGGIYYTGPSDDLLSRPGRMWWSVPAGVTEFSTWRELTTVYHEGVPGHHLQIGQTVYRRELLNTWRRIGSWSSGHGEGWRCMPKDSWLTWAFSMILPTIWVCWLPNRCAQLVSCST